MCRYTVSISEQQVGVVMPEHTLVGILSSTTCRCAWCALNRSLGMVVSSDDVVVVNRTTARFYGRRTRYLMAYSTVESKIGARVHQYHVENRSVLRSSTGLCSTIEIAVKNLLRKGSNTMKSYCTKNNGDCETCSLVNYGRDCRNVPLAADDRQAEALAVEIVKLSEAQFQHEMSRAKTFQGLEHDRASYWPGYQRGLRRAFHGEAFGTMQEHTLWLEAASSDDAMRRQRGQGYRDGLRGKPSDDCAMCGGDA